MTRRRVCFIGHQHGRFHSACVADDFRGEVVLLESQQATNLRSPSGRRLRRHQLGGTSHPCAPVTAARSTESSLLEWRDQLGRKPWAATPRSFTSNDEPPPWVDGEMPRYVRPHRGRGRMALLPACAASGEPMPGRFTCPIRSLRRSPRADVTEAGEVTSLMEVRVSTRASRRVHRRSSTGRGEAS